MPPSPVVMILLPKNEKEPPTPKDPTLRPLYVAPCASAASSTTWIPCFAAMAAIGVAQLERIDHTLERKREIADRYRAGLNEVPGVAFQPEMDWARNVYWMVSVLVDPSLRDGLMSFLGDRGIETRPFFYPAHTLPMYARGESFPVAERLSESGINLPSGPTLTDGEIDFVCEAVAQGMSGRA
jgi:dTDP-4-amino-4,6-dideoxygalactose transaminase